MQKTLTKGFTLIELLIVVAIIAILAAIAVPNFLEAQTRSKVSRAKADIRSLTTALEAYRVDNNAYPQCNPNNVSRRLTTDPQTPTYWVLEHLSTPVAYMTSGILPDPFKSQLRSGVPNASTGDYTPTAYTAVELEQEGSFKYFALAPAGGSSVSALTGSTNPAKSFWVLWSVGPDTIKTQLAGTGLLGSSATVAATLANTYDTTNGTISNGDVFRIGGTDPGAGNAGGAFYSAISKVTQ